MPPERHATAIALKDGQCPTCGHVVDIVANHEASVRRMEAFARSHSQIRCPHCRKRVSAQYDSIDAMGFGGDVGMKCGHCGWGWVEPRFPRSVEPQGRA